MHTQQIDTEQLEGCIQRLAATMTGAATTGMMVLGHRLGLYQALASHGPASPEDLAAATDTAPRYLHEWLLQQTAAGFLTHDAGNGTFALPPAHAAVLVSEASPTSLISGTLVMAGWIRSLDRLEAAFRTGEGVPWHEQDPDVFDGTEDFFGAGYRASLVDEWIPALQGVADKLAAGATVADVGCGHGVTTLLLADAYPQASVIGYDFHDRSIAVARQRAREAGLADRVTFEVADVAGYPVAGYDLICMFDVLHDLGDPLAAAIHARRALSDDGTLLLVEPRAADDLETNLAAPLAALNYAASTYACVPTSLAQDGKTALGAQTGRNAVEQLTRTAGFTRFRELEPTMVNQIYELRP